MDRTSIFLECFEVAIRVVWLAIFPAGEIDANEFERQGTIGLVMTAAVFEFVVRVKIMGPGFSKSASRVLVEGLATEFGAAVAEVDSLGITALPCDGGNAVELGDFDSAVKSVSLSSESHEQTWSQARAGTWEAAKDGSIRMLVHGFLDRLIQLLNTSMQGLEHVGEGFDAQASRHNDSRIVGEGLGVGDGLEAFLNEGVAAAIVLEEEGP